MSTKVQPAGNGQAFRLDPARLPQRLCYRPGGADGQTEFFVTRRGASVRRLLNRSGLAVSIALPARAFRGVAVRAIGDDPDSALVSIEMLHADPQLSVPLCLGGDLASIAQDWRFWAELMGLPMLLIDADGAIERLDDTFDEIDMRARSAERRPRFLARRRFGDLGVRLTVAGERIIARHPVIKAPPRSPAGATNGPVSATATAFPPVRP